jgi:GLPGLI family protein
MNQRILWKTLSLAVALGIALPAFSQGTYWETETTGGPLGDKPHVAMMYHMPKMFKSVTDNEATILLIEKQMMYMVDTTEKTYSEVTFDEMEGMMKKSGEQMDERMAEMQKQMEGMSEDERKMVEQMMGNRMPGSKKDKKDKKDTKVDVTKTDEKKTINGYACTKVVVTDDGKEFLTAWVTKDVKGFEGMRKDLEEFRKRMAAMNPMMPKGLSEAMGKLEGFPIEMEMAMGVKQVVTKIERKSIKASEFEVPEGYKKVKPKFMEEDKQDKK